MTLNTTRKFLRYIVASTSLLFFITSAKADEPSDIELQVWQPFVEAWKNMDAEKLLSLHTNDVVRVMEREQSISSGSDYLDELERMIKMMHKQGVTSDIELRFSGIVTEQNLSWQHGIYRAKMHHPVKGEMLGYAAFSVLLEKDGDTWKIKFDHDTPSTEAAFIQLSGSKLTD